MKLGRHAVFATLMVVLGTVGCGTNVVDGGTPTDVGGGGEADTDTVAGGDGNANVGDSVPPPADDDVPGPVVEAGVGPSTEPLTPLPLPPSATVLYFSDCEEGAADDCVPGNNANAGTAAMPKRTLAGVNIDGLPAGSQLLFKRGGAWTIPLLRLNNENVTPEAPLVFDAYSAGPAPIFRGVDFVLIEFGGYQNTNNDGGYYFRSIVLDGHGVSDWGFWLRDNLRDVTFDRIELRGFKIAIHQQSEAPHGVSNTHLRNSLIHHNSDMGMLGKMNGGLIEGNVFAANNFSGSGFSHAIYLSGGHDNVIRNNRFERNSTQAGVCTGGNVTIHGQNDRLTIEGNVIEQDAAEGTCYGFSITPGYNSVEWFRNVVVRNNTIINTGNCSVCVGAAPGIVVENNLTINTMPGAYHVAVAIPTNTDPGSGDDVDAGAVVRNNVMCQAQPHASGAVASVQDAAVLEGNVLRQGADASTGPCVLPD